MIEAEGVGFAYGDLDVLRDAGLCAERGETVGLIGPNGSGKTTMLRLLYRALVPAEGVVRLDGQPAEALRPRELARRAAVVVQESASEVPITVADMVLLGRAPHRPSFAGSSAEDHRIAAAALERVGVRHLADRVVAALSGGERQRVLIARAIAQQADHLLLDEPTNHLDIRYQHEVLGLVRALPVTSVVVLHDLNLAARYCDRAVLLDEGRVAAEGPVDAVLQPEVLEPVYGVGVRRVDDDGLAQLVFRPAAADAAAAARPEAS